MYSKATRLYNSKTPFVFISNFDSSKIEVYTLSEALDEDIQFTFNENYKYKKHLLSLEYTPSDFENYRKKILFIKNEIKKGNTYLLNFTVKTPIKINYTLDQIYQNANASFKVKYKDKFVSFSPERFVKIKDNKIYTYPMKGTINANIKNAKDILLSDHKELSEHTMIVDLLRNDLNILNEKTKVNKFREVIKIDAGKNKLLQVISEVEASMKKDTNFADLLKSILPAGSISGTPKKNTIKIIKEIEDYDRGYYSGVFAYFDGDIFDSCVMIRFIEKEKDKFYYKSGGGITHDSNIESEYDEMLNKIYIP